MNEQELSAREAMDRLRLIRSENVGPATFRQLLARFGTAGKALESLSDLARRGGRDRALRMPGLAEVKEEISRTRDAGGQFVHLGTSAYPPSLAILDDSPPVLIAKGHLHLLNQPILAIVGSRNASAAGIRLAEQFAGALGEKGLVIASGLARGIDIAAHKGALASGTIAVVAGGIDVVYPPENRDLQHQISKRGLVLSEMPLGTRPLGRHFPRRNRIVSGLSLGVVIVEAAARSGSLITARLASDQGREVFAVPGSPLDPRHQGTNTLIRDGAVLVRHVSDILEVLEPMLKKPFLEPEEQWMPATAPTAPDEDELAEGRALVTPKLGPTPTHVDDLIRQTGLTPAVVLTILLELELAGKLDRHAGNKVSVVEDPEMLSGLL